MSLPDQIKKLIEKAVAALEAGEAQAVLTYLAQDNYGTTDEYFAAALEKALKEKAKEAENDYSQCPFCGAALEVDVEYMQDSHGASWSRLPKSEWTFFCPDEEGCGEAGTLESMKSWKQHKARNQ